MMDDDYSYHKRWCYEQTGSVDRAQALFNWLLSTAPVIPRVPVLPKAWGKLRPKRRRPASGKRKYTKKNSKYWATKSTSPS